jgi:hypothetical protein
MKVTVRWERDTRPYDDKDRSGDQWLIAEAKVPPYGPRHGNFWVVFLEGDRIRVKVADGTPIELPAKDDPYVVQGVLDEEANRAMAAAEERWRIAAEEEREYRREEEAKLKAQAQVKKQGETQ